MSLITKVKSQKKMFIRKQINKERTEKDKEKQEETPTPFVIDKAGNQIAKTSENFGRSKSRWLNKRGPVLRAVEIPSDTGYPPKPSNNLAASKQMQVEAVEVVSPHEGTSAASTTVNNIKNFIIIYLKGLSLHHFGYILLLGLSVSKIFKDSLLAIKVNNDYE
uniref:Uncharacterized protein n=1 Tax=Glossina palpalis gambiensis TaxID=67801 RepID=A0A1B0BGR8_9MUSC